MVAGEKGLIRFEDVYEYAFVGAHRGSLEDEDFNAIVNAIESVPKVDAAEAVHGHWCWEGKFKACSKCGSYVEWDETLGANFWKFCPYCGAKMDGGADNGC